jgi:CheY-like chemotaxis protein
MPSDSDTPTNTPSPDVVAKATSELNNLLQIIAGSSSALEKTAPPDQQAAQYLEMLRASVNRAELLGQELARHSGGAAEKSIHPSEVPAFLEGKTGSKSQPSRRTILVVDDEKMTLTLMDRLLTEAGYDVVVAQSGFECLDLFRRQPHRYAMVLLDLSLPFMDGEETFRRLREIRSDIAVVLCTGFILQDRLTHMMGAGLTGFLRKPVPPDEMLNIVKGTLQKAMYSPGNVVNDGISLVG